MKEIQFIHCGDLHIGTNRLKIEERKKDFILSFKEMAEYAIKNKVNFILITGDFFDKKQIDPDSLDGAIEVLSLLKEAGIEVIVIEGNHDTSIYADENSWLYFLSKKDYLKLLNIKFVKGEPIITDWNNDSKIGTYIDIEDIRIFGLGYLGASTKKKIELLTPHLKFNKFNIMMLHASIDSMRYSDLGGIKKEDIEILKSKIQYLALGHIHKKYVVDKWMYNPGALENWKLDESKYNKGYFHVKLESGKIKDIIFKESKKRPIYSWDLDITGCNDSNDVYHKLINFMNKQSFSHKPEDKPIVSLTYVGKIDFSTLQIDDEIIRAEIKKRLNTLHCEIKHGTNILSASGNVIMMPSKHEIEIEEIGKLIDLHPEYKKNKEIITDLILSFKTNALSGMDDDELIDMLKNNIRDLK